MNRVIFLLSLVVFFSAKVFASNELFTALRPKAERAMALAKSEVRLDRERALSELVEFVIRAQDQLDTDDKEEMEFMMDAMVSLGELRRDLKGADMSGLLSIMLFSGINSISAHNYFFENITNIYPELPYSLYIKDCDVEKYLASSLDAMKHQDLKWAEQILIKLYDKTWIKQESSEYKYKVANNLGLLYLRLGMTKQAEDMMRQNKIEMERNGILDLDYARCIYYTGRALNMGNGGYMGPCFIEAAFKIAFDSGMDVGEVPREYNTVMTVIPEPKRLSGAQSDVLDFITKNDEIFWFLTDTERIERWKLLSDSWEEMKRHHSETSDLNDILNIFQYEKQIMLRSYSKLAEYIFKTGNEEAIEMYETLTQLRMKRATTACSDSWTELNAKYLSLQKALLHHPALSGLRGCLYTPQTTDSIAKQLNPDEIFIDFGVLGNDDTDWYCALMISRDCPDGKLIHLCPKVDLDSFINETERDTASEMVATRYEDSNERIYNMIWQPLEESRMLRDNIMYCPGESINAIMPEAIMHKEEYLAEKYRFHILSSADAIDLIREGESYKPASLVALYAIDYIGDRSTLIRDAQYFGSNRPVQKDRFDVDRKNEQYGWRGKSLYPIDRPEQYDWLDDLCRRTQVRLYSFTDSHASEYLFKNLSNKSIGAVHISTHTFYIPPKASLWDYPYQPQVNHSRWTFDYEKMALYPLYRTGILLSGAGRIWSHCNRIDGIEDGIILGEELSALDLHDIPLLTLIACSTGNGEIDQYEGSIGLRRAFKLSGCRTMVTTAWDIDREAALLYVETFYTNLLEGKGISESHHTALQELMLRFYSPYYWGAFQLID